MIRSVLVLLAGLALSITISAAEEEQQVIFPNVARCGDTEKVEKFLKDYNEIGFASGNGVLQSARDNKFYTADVKIYLSNSGSFTVTAQMDKGIVCVLLVGEDFKPIIPIDQMH